PVRCTRLAYQVDPISTRLCWASTFIKRVLPTMVFVFLSITTKGRETPICCSERALFKYESMVAGEGTVVYHNSQSLPSDAANARSTLWDFSKGTSLTSSPSSSMGLSQGSIRWVLWDQI